MVPSITVTREIRRTPPLPDVAVARKLETGGTLDQYRTALAHAIKLGS
jgi:hypothetical protein